MGIMGKNKTSGVKKRLYKKINQNESVSAWIVLKTKRKVLDFCNESTRLRYKVCNKVC